MFKSEFKNAVVIMVLLLAFQVLAVKSLHAQEPDDLLALAIERAEAQVTQSECLAEVLAGLGRLHQGDLVVDSEELSFAKKEELAECSENRQIEETSFEVTEAIYCLIQDRCTAVLWVELVSFYTNVRRSSERFFLSKTQKKLRH